MGQIALMSYNCKYMQPYWQATDTSVGLQRHKNATLILRPLALVYSYLEL